MHRTPLIQIAMGALAWLLFCGGVFRDTLHESTTEGRRLYDAKKYAEAMAAYGRGRAESPDHPVLAFNVGDTLLAMGKTDEALAEYRRVLGTDDPQLKARTLYNMGNAHLQKNDLPQAIDAYRQSLLLKPGQKDAKRNLELALRKQQEQQKQSQDGQNQQSKDQRNQGQQDKGSQDQNGQDQKQQDKDQQGKDQQSKEQQSKDQQGKNQQGKDQQGKDQAGQKPGQRNAQDRQSQQGKKEPVVRMDKAQAQQLLQALGRQEKAELIQLLQQQRKAPRKEGKDW